MIKNLISCDFLVSLSNWLHATSLTSLFCNDDYKMKLMIEVLLENNPHNNFFLTKNFLRFHTWNPLIPTHVTKAPILNHAILEFVNSVETI